MCHCTEYKLSELQVSISEKNKLNATTQQVITPKISGCALKQGSETHSLNQNPVKQTFGFSFSLLGHYQIPECFFVNKSCF